MLRKLGPRPLNLIKRIESECGFVITEWDFEAENLIKRIERKYVVPVMLASWISQHRIS